MSADLEHAEPVEPDPDAPQILDQRAYRAAVQRAAGVVPLVDAGIVERLSADPEGAVCALLNRLRSSPAASGYLLTHVLTATHFASHRHLIKQHRRETAETCRTQAKNLEDALKTIERTITVSPHEQKTVSGLIKNLRRIAKLYEKDDAYISQKLDAPNAAITFAIKDLSKHINDPFWKIPRLKPKDISTLLTVAFGSDVSPRAASEALRGCGDYSRYKAKKSPL